jgi:hypothetical protein
MSSSATDNDSEHFSNPLRAQRSRTEPKILANGIIEFALDDVNEHITCKLCSGYFRDPVTITECLHTFCKSCLYYAFSHKFTKCPTCQVDLGTDPFKLTLSDRNVQELVEKVLFPNLGVQEMAQERRFYSSRGIELKPECEENFLDRENPKDTEARNKPSYHSQQVIRRTLICKHSFCEEILSLTMNYFLDLCIHYPGRRILGVQFGPRKRLRSTWAFQTSNSHTWKPQDCSVEKVPCCQAQSEPERPMVFGYFVPRK